MRPLVHCSLLILRVLITHAHTRILLQGATGLLPSHTPERVWWGEGGVWEGEGAEGRGRGTGDAATLPVPRRARGPASGRSRSSSVSS